ncbi:MAG: flippase-like domain-containing protein [Bacteroidales bacterium]|nr:flippase-like domain-containing protein [Bacteroidales bacterium]
MKKKVFKVLRYTIFLLIGVLLLYLAFRGIDLEALWDEFKQARYIWIFLSVLVLTLSHMTRAYRWKLLIEPLNYKPLYSSTFFSLMIGYLANYAFPRIGEITRCGALGRTEKIPMDKLFGTVIVERVIDLVTMFLFLIILITAKFEFFSSFIKPNILDPIGNKLSFLLGKTILYWFILIGTPLLLVILLYLFRSRLYKWPLIRKIRDIIKGVFTGLKTVSTLKKVWPFIISSLLIWIFYWFMTYIAFFALPSTSNLNLIDSLFILVIGSFAFIAPVQGGIGAFHWIVSGGLLLYGLTKEEGLAYATITHGSQMLGTILIGSISMLLLISIRKKRNIKQHEHPEKHTGEDPSGKQAQ